MSRTRGAFRAVVGHEASTEPDLATLVAHARRIGLHGWVRRDGARALRVHAEGESSALDALEAELRGAAWAGGLELEPARVEGHEQFAIRGVSAGIFVVQEHLASTHHFDLRLEVEGVLRSWAVPKGPTLDPAVRRLAVEVEDHSLGHADFEGPAGAGGVIVWDRGSYEQGGRVPWPEALARGHAVFVLHGEKLRGGFALQRTREEPPAQWLLIKRRDEEARPGVDVIVELPGSVLSGRTLDQLR